MVERVTIASGLLYLAAHGFAADDEVSLRIVSDPTLGAADSELPGGLAEATTYYVRPSSADAFALATSPSPAAAIATFSAEPVGRFVLLVDPAASLDAAIDDAWETVLAHCTAHGGDVSSPLITLAAKYLAARLYVAHLGSGDPAAAVSYDGIAALWESTYKPLLDTYLRGVPVRGATDGTPATSEGSARYRALGAAAPTTTSWGTSGSDVV
jgi:hypothetical protein